MDESESYRDAELGLIFGVLDALPEPVALLDPDGAALYVNTAGDGILPDDLDYSSVADGRLKIDGKTGFARKYRIANGGELLFFTPDEDGEDELYPSRLPYVSAAMGQVAERVARLANVNAGVLVVGEDGTGRESFARELHGLSAQKSLPFVGVDCRPASGGFMDLLTDEKRQTELGKAGLIFFGHIDALTREEQDQLLTIVRDREIGETRVDGRFCYSALPAVDELALSGAFSDELLRRVALMRLNIPPLRERPDDIPPLARAYLRKYAKLHRKPVSGFSEEVWEYLERNEWAYNLRDMDRFIGDSVLKSQGGVIESGDVPFAVRQPVSLRKSKNKFTYARIDALVAVHGDTTEGKRRVASELGIGLSTLYRIIAKQEREKKLGMKSQ
ncbi:hypothetical protein FACS1894208_08050 [Clostridia bacterium]|nr:hypothetical protein FACS1894208_08050 [Clostridia bacterium]